MTSKTSGVLLELMRKGNVLLVVAFVVALAVGVFIGSRLLGKKTQFQSPSIVSEPQTQQDKQEEADKETKEVKIFLIAFDPTSGKPVGCGDSLVAVTRQVPETKAVLRAAINELLSLKEQTYGQSGLHNALYNSSLTLDDVYITGGKATVKLAGTLSLSGECDDPRVEGQLKETALQFPTVKEVEILVNGKNLEDLLSGRGQ